MMPTTARLLSALALLAPGAVSAADAPGYLGEADCRIAALKPAPVDNRIAWNGGCKDGYADGKGALEWRTGEKKPRRIEGTLVRGEIAGEATLTYQGGAYIGTFRHGVPHGSGYFKHANEGGLYEGGVVDGKREGAGMHIAPDRSTYEGQWKAGKRHGFGKAVFALGGSYEGEWREGEFNGKGKIVYAGSGSVHEGEFHDGRPAAAAPEAAREPGRFTLKSERTDFGSRFRSERAVGFAPLDAPWQALTPGQQRVVRDAYPALDERDEPPYPLEGTRAFYKATADVYQKFVGLEGSALVYVLVGTDGAPKSASVIGAPHPDLGRYLSMVAMTQRFKPASCAGKPCEMIYPAAFQFTTD
ncbi:hypothetical protein [Massilia sp. DD77]|uniref:hypothetical protein n=1 Tax=Massilia sp. DD77 TaxID=3109349 RepID=UPI002FFE306A